MFISVIESISQVVSGGYEHVKIEQNNDDVNYLELPDSKEYVKNTFNLHDYYNDDESFETMKIEHDRYILKDRISDLKWTTVTGFQIKWHYLDENGSVIQESPEENYLEDPFTLLFIKLVNLIQTARKDT